MWCHSMKWSHPYCIEQLVGSWQPMCCLKRQKNFEIDLSWLETCLLLFPNKRMWFWSQSLTSGGILYSCFIGTCCCNCYLSRIFDACCHFCLRIILPLLGPLCLKGHRHHRDPHLCSKWDHYCLPILVGHFFEIVQHLLSFTSILITAMYRFSVLRFSGSSASWPKLATELCLIVNRILRFIALGICNLKFCFST